MLLGKGIPTVAVYASGGSKDKATNTAPNGPVQQRCRATHIDAEHVLGSIGKLTKLARLHQVDDAIDAPGQNVHEMSIYQIGGNPANVGTFAGRTGPMQGVDLVVCPQRFDQMAPDQPACAGNKHFHAWALRLRFVVTAFLDGSTDAGISVAGWP